MKYRKLGSTGITVSEIGFGTIQLTNLSLQESEKLIRKAYELGINWFDTSRVYFNSERNLGYAARDIRDEITIITKSQSIEVDQLKKDLDTSLKELGTDYIDVYLFHKGTALLQDNFDTENGLLETVMKEKEKGKIRHIGFSAHSTDIVEKGVLYDELEVFMVPANFISTEFIDSEFMKEAVRRNKGVLGMKPFGGGRIDNKEICIKFLKNYPFLLPCFGMKSIDELKYNIDRWMHAGEVEPSDLKEMERIKKLLGKRFCRGCGYCMPCPMGIKIPLITFLKIHDMEVPEDELYTQEVLEDVKKAYNCINCRKCVGKCPYCLEIPSMLKDNVDFYMDKYEKLKY